MRDLEARINAAEALIFDCDGTLLKTPDLYALGWQSAFGAAGLKIDADWYHARAGMSEHVLMDEFEAERGVTLDRGQTVRDLRKAVLRQMHTVAEIPAIASIARKYHDRKPVAVASGGPKAIVIPALEAAGLLPLFKSVVTMDDVANAKPSPDLFLLAAENLAIPAKACLVFEDSPQGLLAAERAGMSAIDVNGLM